MLWYTDRSAYLTGVGRCPRERYLSRHSGPTGYGLVRVAESLPLVTGTHVHMALEGLLRYLQETDQLPSLEVVQAEIARAVTAYEARVAARGYRGLLGGESVESVLVEQQCLLGGLVWAFNRTLLPWIHREFRVVAVEQERVYVLDCTCGLPPAAGHEAHRDRDCAGIGLQLRQDVLAERRRGGGLAYLEFKTSGRTADTFAEQWETRPQFGLGTLMAPGEVTELYVIGLAKGQRRKDTTTGGLYQASPFCYGYCRPGNPPLTTEDWLPSYQWIDEEGRTRRAPRDYVRTPISALLHSGYLADVATSLPDVIRAWVDVLPEPTVREQVFLVGPLNRQDAQLAALLRGITAEERRWQDRLWTLYGAAQAGLSWADPQFQAELDRLVPQSWECRRFGSRHECEFAELCFQRQGWQDPIGGGRYQPRCPHHTPELEQAVARGLLVEQTAGPTEDEED